jgi:hypothetical protein
MVNLEGGFVRVMLSAFSFSEDLVALKVAGIFESCDATSVSVLETDVKTVISGFNWKETQNCKECGFHCYVEPSLALSGDLQTYLKWAL